MSGAELRPERGLFTPHSTVPLLESSVSFSSFQGHPTRELQGTGNGTLCYQVPPWFINAVHEHSTLVAPLFQDHEET